MSEETQQQNVGEFIAQSKQNAESLRNIRIEFNDGFNQLRQAIDRIAERVNVATKPNFSTLAAVCGLMLSAIVAIAGPIGFFFWNSVEGVKSTNRDRYEETLQRVEQNNKRIERVERWNDQLIFEDLRELRERRRSSQ